MSTFLELKHAIKKQMDYMTINYQQLFKVDASKDELWDTYINSFKPEDNPIYRERTEHDCQCCKQFIRACGNMVAITDDNQIVSIWDIVIDGTYQPVVTAMSKLIKSKDIRSQFLHCEKSVGTDFNYEMRDGTNVNTWHHFYYVLPKRFVEKDQGVITSKTLASKALLSRGITELTQPAMKQALELIEAGSLYRGDEHKGVLQAFMDLAKQAATIPANQLDLWAWKIAASNNLAARFKNSVIGTLVSDLSTGVELGDAVRMFESKVAPENYKRTSALITPTMIKQAKEKVTKLGLIDSLDRRYAVKDDITVNNVLYADRNIVLQSTNVFDRLTVKAATQNTQNLKGAKEISIADFMDTIVPIAKNIELLVENRLEHNMMSLIAPSNTNAAPLFKWDNGFSWAYNGDVADSMKDRVKAAGGKTEGVLRFSIMWNEDGNNDIDLDAHCYEPNGTHIYYGNARRKHTSSGMLDVDIQRPGNKVAVENIIWTDPYKIPKGDYVFKVHNYESRRSNQGFTAEIEYDGTIHTYTYDRPLRGKEYIQVATAHYSKQNGIVIADSLPSTEARKDVWGLTTQTFCKVSLITHSPNHWDDKVTGNKHLFFILDKCNSGTEARGFYNEFLRNDLHENRKTFELLRSEMKAQKSQDQLSGLGFSSTQRNHVYCKVTGEYTRLLKINF